MKQIIFLLPFMCVFSCVKSDKENSNKEFSQSEDFYPYTTTTTKVAFYDDKGVEIGHFEQPVVWEWRKSQGGRYYPIHLGKLTKCFKNIKHQYYYVVDFGELRDTWTYGGDYAQSIMVGIFGSDINLKGRINERMIIAGGTENNEFGGLALTESTMFRYRTKQTEKGRSIIGIAADVIRLEPNADSKAKIPITVKMELTARGYEDKHI